MDAGSDVQIAFSLDEPHSSERQGYLKAANVGFTATIFILSVTAVGRSDPLGPEHYYGSRNPTTSRCKLDADNLEDALQTGEIRGITGVERQTVGGSRGGNEQVC